MTVSNDLGEGVKNFTPESAPTHATTDHVIIAEQRRVNIDTGEVLDAVRKADTRSGHRWTFSRLTLITVAFEMRLLTVLGEQDREVGFEIRPAQGKRGELCRVLALQGPRLRISRRPRSRLRHSHDH